MFKLESRSINFVMRKSYTNWILATEINRKLIFGWFWGTQQDLWVIIVIYYLWLYLWIVIFAFCTSRIYIVTYIFPLIVWLNYVLKIHLLENVHIGHSMGHLKCLTDISGVPLASNKDTDTSVNSPGRVNLRVSSAYSNTWA